MVDVRYIETLMEQVPNPEVPVLNIKDLGVLRSVEEKGGQFEIVITPTYSGCPAMHAIEENIHDVLRDTGISNYRIKTVISPAWTTDWMSDSAKQKLKEYGIAPPERSTEEHLKAIAIGKNKSVTCPFCNSTKTHLTSAFGSTACKALHYCDSCDQPFEEFKCH